MTQDAETGQAPAKRGDLRAVTRRVLAVVASVVRLVTVVFAAILVIHIVLRVASANPGNGITTFFAGAADHLTLGLGTLFLPSSAVVQVVVDYGIAAVVWLIIGFIIARVLGALAP